MEGTERTIRIEEDPTRYELLVGPQTAASSWRRTQRAGALFLGAGLMVSTVSFAMQSPLQQDLLEVKPTVVHEKAFIIIVRHGEKHHGDGDIVKLGGWWAQKIESRFSFPVVDAVSTHSRVHSFWSLVL